MEQQKNKDKQQYPDTWTKVSGNLVADPEVKTSKKDEKYAEATIIDNNSKDKQAHKLIGKGKQKEQMMQYKKGDYVYAEGGSKTKQYTNKKGQEKTDSTVFVQRSKKLEKKKEKEQNKKQNKKQGLGKKKAAGKGFDR